MNAYEDQQREEVEAMMSIYPDAFTVFSESPYNIDMRIEAESNDIGEFHCVLNVKLPEKYPEEPPNISVSSYSSMLSESSIASLLCDLRKLAQNSVGEPSLYTLLLSAKEVLDNNVTQHMTHKQELIDAEMKSRQIFEEQEDQKRREEERKREGTLVTREVFLAWKSKFDREIALDKKTVTDSTKKLTGRQLFEQDASLATSDAMFMEGNEEIGDSDEDYVDDGSEEIDWELYDDEVDLSDDDDDDEEAVN